MVSEKGIEKLQAIADLQRRVAVLEQLLPRAAQEGLNVVRFNSPRYNPAGFTIAVLADAERDMLVEAIVSALLPENAPKPIHDADNAAASILRDFDAGLDRSGDGVALHSVSQPGWFETIDETIEALTEERDLARKERDRWQEQSYEMRVERDAIRDELSVANLQIHADLEEIEADHKMIETLHRELAEARNGKWPEVVQSLNDGIEQIKTLQAENRQLKQLLLQHGLSYSRVAQT